MSDERCSIEETRTGKVYDWYLGQACEWFESNIKSGIPDGVLRSWDHVFFSSAVRDLLATEAYADLPNRKRLVELVEKAMGPIQP